jgi:putative oxidoreductase
VKLEDIAYTALRIITGALFMIHGAQKLFGVLGGSTVDVGSQLWIGGWIELVGGLLIATGLLVRPAAFICAGQMAVAYFQFHWKFHFDHYLWLPMVNQGEDSVLYCFIFLLFSIRGAGPFSLDRRWRAVE